MINIQPADLIGTGVHRKCYIHPENADQCIKIVYRGGQAETIREQKYYRYLSQKGISWEMLAQFHGNIETNFGTGAVFDLVRDYDGSISKTLDTYFNLTDETTGRCVIIDNIGNSDFIPICTYNKFLGNKKILRKWKRFEKALSKEYLNNADLKHILLQLRQA
ncbi:YrbL family protein [uncultured Desulfobacter sp.]|uniref:YrbL family protein n=1 Tax=uncultured Desulfobacter sp. TaxID=240139 RepID=UPI002AA7A764|nr:YrbL family protein [uncultured Desulfobacter sp.]